MQSQPSAKRPERVARRRTELALGLSRARGGTRTLLAHLEEAEKIAGRVGQRASGNAREEKARAGAGTFTLASAWSAGTDGREHKAKAADVLWPDAGQIDGHCTAPRRRTTQGRPCHARPASGPGASADLPGLAAFRHSHSLPVVSPRRHRKLEAGSGRANQGRTAGRSFAALDALFSSTLSRAFASSRRLPAAPTSCARSSAFMLEGVVLCVVLPPPSLLAAPLV